MKKYLFIATALAALASCSDNEFLGDNSPNGSNNPNETKAIVFSSGTKAVTRAAFTGETAAKMLNENFVFFGTKTVADTRSTVFDHYIAKWFENTANTTASNSNDWEYVGYEPVSGLTSLPTGATQSIKYWDYAATQYDFAAYSLGKGYDADGNPATTDDITFAEASKIDFSKLGSTDAAYTLTGTVNELKECYISDLVTAYNTSVTTGEGQSAQTYKANTFGQVVTFSFRSLASKIRLAFYETIPGYSVKNVQFYNMVDKNDQTLSGYGITATSSTTPSLLAADDEATLPTQTSTDDQIMEVYFQTTGWDNAPENGANSENKKTDYNKAHIKLSSTGAKSSLLTFDALDDFAGVEKLEDVNEYIGRASNAATYAGGLENGSGKYYTILPSEAGVNLMIRIKYTLVSTDGSDEEITVDNATAVIPLELASWKPNYAYTYIFKISDMTNGTTGVDKETGKPVMGLTPITLNAVVVDSEDGVQETITTVSDPSITTYMAGKVVTDNDEYKVYGTTTHPIYIVVNNGQDNVTLTTTGNTTNAKLYTAVLDGTNATQGTTALNTISEESVDNALRYGKFEDGKNLETTSSFTVTDANGWKLIVTKEAEYNATNNTKGLKSETAIPAAESPTGDVVNLTCASFVPEDPTSPATVKYYVFQYKGKTDGKYGTYTPVAPATLETSGTTYYTESGGTYTAVASVAQNTQVIKGGTVYYTKGEDIYEPVTGALVWGTTYYYQEGANWTSYVAGSQDPQPSNNKYYIKKDYKPVEGDQLTEGVTYWYQDSQNNNAWVSFVAGPGTTPSSTPQGGYYTQDDNYYEEVTTPTTGDTYWYQDSNDNDAWKSFVAGANDPVHAGGYYTKNENNYIRVPYATLTAGNTYYTTDRGAGKFTATGTEEVDAVDKYFYVESGNEEVDGKYMYKVIKVVQ